MSYSKELVTDLSQFLSVTSRSDVRTLALQHVCSISNSTDILQLIEMEDFLIENALYELFINSLEDCDVILTIFVNITAISSSFAGRLIERDNILPTCFQLAQKKVVGAAKLLANISRHFPARLVNFY